MEYNNLIYRLMEKRIDLKAVAAYLGIDEKTMLNKIYGKTTSGFSWKEVCKIHQAFLPEFEKEYIFFREIDVQTTTA